MGMIEDFEDIQKPITQVELDHTLKVWKKRKYRFRRTNEIIVDDNGNKIGIMLSIEKKGFFPWLVRKLTAWCRRPYRS